MGAEMACHLPPLAFLFSPQFSRALPPPSWLSRRSFSRIFRRKQRDHLLSLHSVRFNCLYKGVNHHQHHNSSWSCHRAQGATMSAVRSVFSSVLCLVPGISPLLSSFFASCFPPGFSRLSSAVFPFWGPSKICIHTKNMSNPCSSPFLDFFVDLWNMCSLF